VKIPVGTARGRDMYDVSVAELEAACDLVDARLCSEPKGSRALKVFVREGRALLRRRKFPTGSYSDTEGANRALRDAAEVGYLIGPSDQVARVLEGTAIIIGAFRADVQLDTFADDEDPARRVPAKPMLDRIASHLGLSWDAANCQRTDDNSSPLVRSCQAAAYLKDFDGSEQAYQAHGEVDLREGSSLTRAIQARFKGPQARLELERRRQFILAHADTSARLRLIRQLRLRDSYLPTELAKPFFVARVMFTGLSASPATQQVFAERIAETFLPAKNALFGKASVAR
jgi:hypothetical protein